MIVVLADDISGAAELASLASAYGLKAELQTVFIPSADADVIAVDADTRWHTASEAAERMVACVREVANSHPAWIYRKTDSVLRGHVRVELSAMLDALNLPLALLVPANPGKGRCIQNGRYSVQNVPLDQTVFASDPDHPARTADVRQLLCREPGVDVHWFPKGGSLPAQGIAIPDIQSKADLHHFAKLAGPTLLCAGGVEFFEELLQFRCELSAPGPVQAPRAPASHSTLLVCGSAAAWPARTEECGRRGASLFALPREACIAPESDVPKLFAPVIQQIAAALAERNFAVVAIGDLTLPPSITSRQLLLLLAQFVAMILQVSSPARLLLEGGATAAAVLSQMNWSRLHPIGHLGFGLSLIRLVSKSGPDLVIKPGSYPWPETVWPPAVV